MTRRAARARRAPASKAAEAAGQAESRRHSSEHPLLALQRSAGNSAVTESLLARDGAKAPPKKEEPTTETGFTVTIEGVGEFKAGSMSFAGQNEVVITKESDELSTTLMKLMLNGTSLPKMVIASAHVTFTLVGVMIANMSIGSGGDKPMETLTFSFTGEGVKYSGDDDAGGSSPGYP